MNKLSLSIENTNYMIFSDKNIDKSNIFTKIDQTLIKQVMITEFLGVMIDSHFQWKAHINCVNLKILKCIAIMYYLRDIFMVNTMKQLYNSFIFPYIDYCHAVWGRTYPYNVNPVYILQKKVIKF